jgi:hypothetical protein
MLGFLWGFLLLSILKEKKDNHFLGQITLILEKLNLSLCFSFL